MSGVLRSCVDEGYRCFVPIARKVCEAAVRSAIKAGIDTHWFNDAVKDFMSAQGEFVEASTDARDPVGLSHLRCVRTRRL